MIKKLATYILWLSFLTTACANNSRPIYEGLINKTYGQGGFTLVFYEDTVQVHGYSPLYLIKWVRHNLNYDDISTGLDESVDKNKEYTIVYWWNITSTSSTYKYTLFGYFPNNSTFIRLDSGGFGYEYRLQ